MKSGLLFRALPDSSSVQANVTPDGRLVSTMPNRMILSPAIQQQLAEVAYRFWEPSHVAWPDGLGWIINTCADADEYAGALDYLSRQIAGKDIPVFNHPDAIQKTRRDTVADLLSGIAGLQTPKCVRFLGDHPDRFHEVFNVNGFEYPVLVRLAKSQSGQTLVRVDGPEDWGKVHSFPWGGSYVFMTQFVDFRDSNGRFTKARMVIAGNKISLRHILSSDDWLIHAGNRDQASADHELERLGTVTSWDRMMQVGRDIHARIGLDFFGVDLGIQSDDSFVLFEANAAMSILSTNHTPEYRQQDYLDHIASIERDVVAALQAIGIPLQMPTA